jgi:phosphoglycerate dehydrogenase-like enzyme
MPAKHIVFLDDYEHAMTRLANYEDLAQDAFISVHTTPLRGSELHEAVSKANALVLMRDRTPLSAELLDMMLKLELVIFTGTRNMALDRAALKSRGIPVCHTEWGPSKDATAELAWALIMAAHKQVVGQNALLRSGHWRNSQSLLPVLRGERIGLIGLGEIGGRVAGFAKAFGMEVVTWSPNMTAQRAAEKGAQYVPLEELLATSAIVSLHLVPSAASKHLMNAQRLRLMRPDAILVNTSRSTLIHTPDLISALYAGYPGAAALDVYDLEPLPANDPLRNTPNLILTPHLGFVARPVFRQFATDTHACLSAWLKGQPLPGLLANES